MQIFDEFYQTTFEYRTVYCDTPGELDVTRLIEGQEECWQQLKLVKTKTPKKLLFYDWTSIRWTYGDPGSKIQAARTMMLHLIDQGFSIYMMEAKSPMPISRHKLVHSSDEALRLLLINSMDRSKFPQNSLEQWHFVDNYWINRLLNPQLNPERTLTFSEMNTFQKLSLETKLTELSQASPPLQRIIIDIYDGRFLATNCFKKYQLPYTLEAKALSLQPQELDSLVKNRAIHRGEFTFETRDLERIESFSIEGTTEPTNILEVLNATPNLKDLFLAGNHTKKFPTILALPNLYTLQFDFGSISTDNLALFLSAASNLNTLVLKNCSLSDNSLPSINALLKLKVMSFSSSPIPSTILALLLNAASNLDTLLFMQLDNFLFKQDEDLPEPLPSLNQMTKLKVIDFRYSNISAAKFSLFIGASPNLKIIKLYDCEELSDPLSLPDQSLKQLETFDTINTMLSSANLESILNLSTNIKTINIKSRQSSPGFQTPISPMENLETIKFECVNFPPTDLQKLLAAAKNLTTIDWDNVQALSKPFAIARDSLMRLEILKLKNDNINVDTLMSFLGAAPNLKTIAWTYCKTLRNLMKIPPNSLHKLEVIYFNESNILIDNLRLILKASPNLREVHIDNLSPEGLEQLQQIYPRVKFVIIGDFHPIFARATDPEHHPSTYASYHPNPVQEAAQGKNQAMIIKKLSCYLRQHVPNADEVIKELKKGICARLAPYFRTLETPDWHAFVNDAYSWDGKAETLSANLKAHLDYLLYRWEENRAPYVYLGERLPELLKLPGKYVLNNPWHAIAIRWNSEHSWTVYDPNYINGARDVAASELLNTIQLAIGNLIIIQFTPLLLNSPKMIKDPGQFVQNGGLLALETCTNADEILSELSAEQTYTKAHLDGLKLRSTSGVPGWSYGIVHANPRVVRFTKQLLHKFIELNPSDFHTQLAQSLEALPAHVRQAYLLRISTLFQPPDRVSELDGASSTLPIPPTVNYQFTRMLDNAASQVRVENYLKHFQATHSPVAQFMSQYFTQCIKPTAIKKRLIQLPTDASITTLQLALQQHCQNNNRPVFQINFPRDLTCSANIVERREDNIGVVRSGQGGPLHDFLTNHRIEQAPILIVNETHFLPEEIVSRLNPLLDTPRLADGTPLPDDTIVLVLMNANKPRYQGADFYSRFDKKEPIPFDVMQLEQSALNTLPVGTEEDDKKNRLAINLYHAPDWRARLLGRWTLHGDQLSFQEGLLAQVTATTPLDIRNGLWNDDEFCAFWQQASLKGSLTYLGRTINLPPMTYITRSEGYDWDTLNTYFSIMDTTTVNPRREVLNPGCLGSFFCRYHYIDDKMTMKPGLIESAVQTGKLLSVYLTRTLSEDVWAMLLAQCHRYGVQLDVFLAHDVSVPQPLQNTLLTPPIMPTTTPWDNKVFSNGLHLITSTDPDTTIALIKRTDEQSWIVIDVSECKPSDLLNGYQRKSETSFQFRAINGALLTALNRKQHVILTGHFSFELVDALAPILLDEEKMRSSKLLLVTTQPSPFNYLSSITHTVTPSEKIYCLATDPCTREKLESAIAQGESLSELETRRDYLLANPDKVNSDESWIGLRYLEVGKPPSDHLNSDTSKQEAAQFTTSRRDAVKAVLRRSPFVFLSGLSGVGKSTFVLNELCTEADKLHQGEAAIKMWLEEQHAEGDIVLFLDEATLRKDDGTKFEGLYQNPPYIVHEGALHRLTPKHKLVCAGNPVSYRDRKLATFFKRRGNAVLFEPLSYAVIYEKILLPVFEGTAIHVTDQIAISQAILEVYRVLCEYSEIEVLISPRELQMMALMIMFEKCADPQNDLAANIQHWCYTIAAPLVPHEKKNQFNQAFAPPTKQPMHPLSLGVTSPFLLTASRQPIYQVLVDLLAFRAFRQTQTTNITHQYGGLGGVILKGLSGVGKSKLVMTLLEQQGISAYYTIHVSMPNATKESLLRKAFDEGAIVIIDEINSTLMESLLNALLMGKTPEGKPPNQPGFLVLGTQIPPIGAERHETSTALSRRLLSIQVPEYTDEEMKLILLNKGFEVSHAEDMVTAYNKAIKDAEQSQRTPPTFHDVISLATRELSTRRAASALPSQSLFSGSGATCAANANLPPLQHEC